MPILLLLLPLAAAAPAGPVDAVPSGAAAAPAAHRAPPTPEEVEKWSATDYNSYLVDNELATLREVQQTVNRFVQAPTPEAYAAYEKDLKRALHDGLANARLLPPWHGDPGFRDAVVEGYDELIRLVDKDLSKMFALAVQEEVHNADLASMEALQAHIEEVSHGVDTTLQEAQRGFATRQGFGILPAEPAPTLDIPEFSAPGFPPPQSRLSAGVHVGFAMKYHNRLVARETRLVGAMNGFFGATSGTPDKVEEARVEALATIRTELAAIRAGEPWQGDDGLRLALLGLGESFEHLLAEDFATYTRMLRAGLRSQAEADQVNGIAKAASPTVQAGIDGFSAAQRQFQDRWALTAYEAWQRQQGWLPPK